MVERSVEMPKMWVNHGRPCVYCDRPMDVGEFDLHPTRDHYPVPKSRGGARTVVCCKKCNNLKGDMSAQEWALFMSENPQWWTIGKKERKAAEPRGPRIIREVETPSNPMREALEQLRFTGNVAHGFNQMFGKAFR